MYISVFDLSNLTWKLYEITKNTKNSLCKYWVPSNIIFLNDKNQIRILLM